MESFEDAIVKFNAMYKLPANEKPSLNIGEDVVGRLEDLKDILKEEIKELDAIITACKTKAVNEVNVLTELADFLGDMQVYCASEMKKFGLPVNAILLLIMESNLSKLGLDGEPIYDERGKVLKGPNYFRPEPKIAALINQLVKGE